MEAIIIKQDIVITKERLDDLLCSAFEGGASYWAITGVTQQQKDVVEAEFAYQVCLNGGEIEVFDAEEPDKKLGVLNAKRLEVALQCMALGQNEKGESKPALKKHFDNFINENDDAETADVFMQMAVMGEIVFG